MLKTLFRMMKDRAVELWGDLMDMKEHIRDLFSYHLGHWWIRLVFIVFILPFIFVIFWLIEISHAWVNVFKGEIKHRLKFSEEIADVAKYPVSITLGIFLIVILELVLTGSFL